MTCGGDERIVLRSARLVAECAPGLGGRLSRLRLIDARGERDLLTPLPAWGAVAWRWPKGGAYPLIPYSNRIRDAALTCGGARTILKAHPDAAPHTLHGPAQLRPWSVLDRDEAAATLGLDHDGDADWPWPFQARQRFTIEDDELRLRIEIVNHGAAAFPAGLGWHPYLALGPGATLRHDARGRWAFDDDFIATGETMPATADFDETDYLSDWSAASIVHADGLTVTLSADPVFRHLVLHRPRGGAYICVEPVTHVSDGFNLRERGVEGTGADDDLAPGASMGGEIRLRASRDAPNDGGAA